MYAYIFISINMCLYLYTHAYKYMPMQACLPTSIHIWIHTNSCMSAIYIPNVNTYMSFIHTHIVYMYVCNMCIYEQTYMHIFPCMSSYKYASILMGIYAYMCMSSMCIYGHVYLYMYTHLCVHAYM